VGERNKIKNLENENKNVLVLNEKRSEWLMKEKYG
jgi:hypothetical protein